MGSIKSFLNNLTAKAGIVSTTENSIVSNPFNIYSGCPYEQDNSPVNLVKLNTGWVATCNSKNANTCASIPLKLYYKNSTGKKPQVTKFRTLDEKTVKGICKSANIQLKQEEHVEEIIEHPLLKLFESINPVMNYYDWCTLNFQYLGLIGNSYNEVVYENNIPTMLNPLLSEYVIPVATGKTQGTITKYIYKPEMNKEIIYQPEQILHFAQYAPGNTLIGRGNLENCLSGQERYLYYDSFEKYLGLNNSRPDFAVNYKNKLSEKDMKDLYRQWNKRFGSVQNSGKVAISSGEMEIKNLSLSPRELQYQVGRTWALKEIAGAFGIPEALVTVQDVNRANAVESMNHYLRNTIFPMMTKYCSKINEVITPKYDANLFVWFEEQYLENPVEKMQNTIAAYTAGILDKNEARSALGYEPVDEDEVVPIEDVKPNE